MENVTGERWGFALFPLVVRLSILERCLGIKVCSPCAQAADVLSSIVLRAIGDESFSVGEDGRQIIMDY